MNMETTNEKFFNWLTIVMLVLCAAGLVCGIIAHLPWYGLVWICATACWVITARMYKASWQAEVKQVKEDLELCRDERNSAWKQANRFEKEAVALREEKRRLTSENKNLLEKLAAMELKPAEEEKPKAKRSKKKISEIKEAVKDITENIKK